MSSPSKSAIAIAAHPDDIEFTMAGTLRLLREVGFRTHYLNISTGSCGSLLHGPAKLSRIRRAEAMRAAAILGAEFHESGADDLEIVYSVHLLRWLTGIIREVHPSIVLTHAPVDYMEDHTNTCRLAVTATFARGIPNFTSRPKRKVWMDDAVIYHAMPHGLCDELRRPVVPGAFVDTSSVQETKLEALKCHQSQQGWLNASQGMNSYLLEMENTALRVGRMSRRFRFAEGWWRHSHMGFGPRGFDPLAEALGKTYRLNPEFEKRLQ